MPKFKKQILRPGKYLARIPGTKDGRREVTITRERIKAWADKFDEMKKAGLRIPAPWKHDGKAIPNPNTGASSSFENAGFWEKLWTERDGSLYGEVDVPRDEDASRVGQTVTEVSPLVRPEFKDGVGRDWKDSILHIALVTHPIMSGQDNFEPVSKDAKPEALAASFALSCFIEADAAFADSMDPSSTTNQGEGNSNDSSKIGDQGATLSECLNALRAVGLDLPDSTSAENLVERIIIASRAIKGSKEGEEGEEGKGEPKEEPAPIVMSSGEGTGDSNDMTDDQKKKAAAAAEEKTKKDLEFAQTQTKQALELASGQAKSGIELRITNLIKTGRVTPAYANKTFKPMLEAFQLSLDDEGKPIAGNLEMIIGALEAQPENKMTRMRTAQTDTSKTGNAFSMEEGPAPDMGEESGIPSPERTEEIVKQQMDDSGRG